MIASPALDSRFSHAPDPRIGRPILKAISRRREPRPPTARQAEAERPLWGPHPDPAIARIEDEFYGWGQTALAGMLSAVLGKKIEPRTLIKASFMPMNARVSGWGQVAELFNTRKDPAMLMDGWSKVIDKLTAALTPPGSAEAAAQALALKTHLMFQIGQTVSEPLHLPTWMEAMDIAGPSQAASMEWTKARSLEYANNLTHGMRHTLMLELMTSKQEGESPKALERRLLNSYGQLNRDWRRIALTETAFAVQNGALASVNPDDGWIAIWIAAPTACPYCLAQSKKQFKVVAADAPDKNGDTQVWVGKSNWGRSAHLHTKDGDIRTKDELYWPCCPAHPHCACHLSLRPAKFAKHLAAYADKVQKGA